MNKTTRSSEKTRPETLSKRAASVKEKKPEKNPPAVSKKQKASRVPTVSPAKAVKNPGKKEPARRAPATTGKSAPVAPARTPQITVQVSHQDAPSQLLRRTKTTASALAQLEKGIEFIYRKDFKKAITELQSLIEKYPNEAEITVRARSYLDICRRSEARQKKTPATNDQTYALGVLEHNRTNYDKAIAYFQQSLEKYPRADYIYYSIAAALTLKGSVAEAIENLRRAVELNGDSRVHAKNDSDFAALESIKEFQELIGVSAPR
ncbi:MAG: tetratricopeptide repeat protein [Acidobacteria bacterium]|nr:tetratricopeptide repeat protein [Acidobacteriota bacterium]